MSNFISCLGGKIYKRCN